MNKPIFSNGITGLSDTKWMGEKGNAHKLVGVDFRSSPGIFKAQQKLKKISEVVEKEGTTNVVTSLCNRAVSVSDGSILWFSSDNGKIWKQSGDTFSLIHTLDIATDYKEPNSVTEIINEDEIDYTATMSISENNFDYGKVSLEQVSFSFNEITNADQISIAQITDTKLLMAYQGADNDGFVSTVNISASGTIHETFIVEFDITRADAISICPISETHGFLSYRGGANNHGFVKVIADNSSVVSTLEHDANTIRNNYSEVCKIDDTHYALVYGGGASGYAYLKIFSIDGAYAITEDSSTLLEEAFVEQIRILKISGNRYVVIYSTADVTKIKLMNIDASYVVTTIDTIEIGTGINSKHLSLSKVDDTHFLATHYSYNKGRLSSFEINESDELVLLDEYIMGTYEGISSNIVISYGNGYYLLIESKPKGTTSSFVFSLDDEYLIKEVQEKSPTGVNHGLSAISGAFTGAGSSYGRKLFLFSSSSRTPIVSTVSMNETFSNGIVLNPSGTDDIELIQSKTTAQTISDNSFVEETIDVKDGTNLTMLVVVGSTEEESYITSITTNGDAMTQVSEDETSGGFVCNMSYYVKTGITSGENVVKVNYSEASVNNAFVAILIFKNVNQTTPTLAIKDSGWKNYLTLPTTTQHSLRIGSFLTRKNTHTHGAYENILAELEIAEGSELFSLSISSRGYNTGTSKILGASEFSYTEPEIVASDKYDYRPEQTLNKIYYCNENILFAVPVDKIDSWSDNIEVIGSFKNGDDTYHPMVNQNLELYIGDDNVMAKVDVNGIFNQETLFNIKSPDRIQTISTFDTDLLVGVVGVNKSKILRWDTLSQICSAKDEVFETGINAFIKDDNYTYVSAGDYGRIYFYDGEKLELYKRIPGDFSSTKKAIINSNSVGFINGHTIFGLSNSSNNPTEQGVYCLGSYDSRYPKSLSLDYPVPTNELTGVSLGAIIVNGSDMYVSYKTSTDVGIAKIDHSNKYNGAYLETMQLTSLVERDDDSIVERIVADYVSMPDNTSVAISTKTKYDTDYTEQTLLVDTDKMSVRTKNSIPKISSLQVKLELTTSGNDSPEIENLGII